MSTRHLADLLRIFPQCEAIVGRRQCKAAGTVRLTATHPKRPVQYAALCPKHAATVQTTAAAAGYAVALTTSEPAR